MVFQQDGKHSWHIALEIRQGWNYVILKRNQLGKVPCLRCRVRLLQSRGGTTDFMFAMVGAGQSRGKQVSRKGCS